MNFVEEMEELRQGEGTLKDAFRDRRKELHLQLAHNTTYPQMYSFMKKHTASITEFNEEMLTLREIFLGGKA